VYAGSIFQQNTGENTTGHGFLVWDLENMSYKLHEVTNKYKIYKFKIEILIYIYYLFHMLASYAEELQFIVQSFFVENVI